MVTRNFLNLLAMSLQSGSNVGSLFVRDVTGLPRYLTGTFGFPANPTKAVTTDPAAAGISVGTGNTPATEDDYQLAEPLSSGINLTLTETVYGVDEGGLPYAQYKVTVTNTGSDPLTVKEICYKQNVGTAKYPGMTNDAAAKVCMLDRTVLDTPVAISPGDAGIITYKLRTIPTPAKTISGVSIVSFTYGTDAQIGAMIDAARQGTIDLQRDGGWHVGDMRKIHIDAFTGGNNVAHAAEDLFIAISSFEEYMSCGNVLQFDFVDCLTAEQRMNPTNTTAGGYGATEMYTDTLPALVEALPSWLKSRLRTFSVLASAGGSSLTTIETVTGNKLALRAAVEVFGANGNGQPGEGTQVDLYKITPLRVKTRGVAGSTSYWWERSAYSTGAFCGVNGNGTTGSNSASYAAGVAPFGCI